MDSSTLVALGFNVSIPFYNHQYFFSSLADSSLFVLGSHSYTILLLVDVDDIILTRAIGTPFERLLTTLNQEFTMKDLDLPRDFFGIEAAFFETSLQLSHGNYAHDIFSRNNMLACKLIGSLSVGARSSSSDGNPFKNPSLFRSIIFSFQYLTLIQPCSPIYASFTYCSLNSYEANI